MSREASGRKGRLTRLLPAVMQQRERGLPEKGNLVSILSIRTYFLGESPHLFGLSFLIYKLRKIPP